MMIVLLLLLQMNVPDAANFVGAPKGTPLAGDRLAQRTAEVGGLLRCPVCQGMSVADSPSEMAVNMKGQVRDLLSRGYTEEQILEYFELSYGQFVLLRPKFEGTTAAVWLLPLLALVAGVAIVLMTMRRMGRPAPPKSEREVASEASDPYLARVRELVTGDKS